MNHAYYLLFQSIVFVLIGAGPLDQKLSATSHVWPESVTYSADTIVQIISEKPTAGGSVYHSNHFELISDHPLSMVVLCDILRVLEASYASHLALPLGFDQPLSKHRHVVKMIDSEDHYVERGGMMGSGGVYLRESREALVRVDTLGAQFSDDGHITAIKNLGLITHEITHQLQHDWLGVLPTWLIEGLAVYLESVPCQDGTLLFKNMHFRTEKHIRRASENQYWITDIQRLMSIERNEWNQHFEEQPISNNRHYVSAFLLTYYFLHLSDEPTGNSLRTYIQNMKQAESHEAQHSALAQLMKGRSYQELEHDLIAAYARANLTLHTTKHF